MKDFSLYLGLDVHAKTIVAVVVDGDGAERNLGVFANRRSSIEKLVEKVGPKERIQAVYEAGPTGTCQESCVRRNHSASNRASNIALN